MDQVVELYNVLKGGLEDQDGREDCRQDDDDDDVRCFVLSQTLSCLVGMGCSGGGEVGVVLPLETVLETLK